MNNKNITIEDIKRKKLTELCNILAASRTFGISEEDIKHILNKYGYGDKHPTQRKATRSKIQ